MSKNTDYRHELVFGPNDYTIGPVTPKPKRIKFPTAKPTTASEAKAKRRIKPPSAGQIIIGVGIPIVIVLALIAPKLALQSIATDLAQKFADPSADNIPKPPPVRAPSGRRVALVIGNHAYQNAAVLKNPVNDAALIAKALDTDGFDVTVADDLNRDDFVTALKGFRAKADNAD
jgi:hypothetical protein